jgi:hypothetical protein
VEGDCNIVEMDVDCSNNTSKKLTIDTREAWNRLALKLGLEDEWSSDDFEYHQSLCFSLNNKQKGLTHCKARLDQYYVGD